MKSKNSGAVTEVFAEDLNQAKVRICKILNLDHHVVDNEFYHTFATENYAQECPLKKVETVQEEV